ncbi:hypothetical protein [Paraclostridium bifermentans]|uniref:hypothetical protein n=1 Tax=Paraclostridium bifermentans TaxID=1490 RepID=UPI00374E955D
MNLISSCLRKEDIFAVVRKQHVVQSLNFMTLDFMTSDLIYKSFQIVFNDAKIFSKKDTYLSVSKSELVAQIKSSIETYESKEDYLNRRPELYDEQSVCEFIKFVENKTSELIEKANNDKFKVRGVSYGWSPVMTIVVQYSYNRVRQSPIIILPNNTNFMQNKYEGLDRDDYRRFIEDIFDERWDYLWI